MSNTCPKMFLKTSDSFIKWLRCDGLVVILDGLLKGLVLVHRHLRNGRANRIDVHVQITTSYTSLSSTSWIVPSSVATLRDLERMLGVEAGRYTHLKLCAKEVLNNDVAAKQQRQRRHVHRRLEVASQKSIFRVMLEAEVRILDVEGDDDTTLTAFGRHLIFDDSLVWYASWNGERDGRAADIQRNACTLEGCLQVQAHRSPHRLRLLAMHLLEGLEEVFHGSGVPIEAEAST